MNTFFWANFRQILLSDTWTDAVGKTMPSTNMYVMLKKRPSTELSTTSATADHFFLPNKKFSLSERVENIVINFLYQTEENHNCCSDLKIFEDLPVDTNVAFETVTSCDEYCEWYQANIFVAGFKDYYVGKVSATDLW